MCFIFLFYDLLYLIEIGLFTSVELGKWSWASDRNCSGWRRRFFQKRSSRSWSWRRRRRRFDCVGFECRRRCRFDCVRFDQKLFLLEIRHGRRLRVHRLWNGGRKHPVDLKHFYLNFEVFRIYILLPKTTEDQRKCLKGGQTMQLLLTWKNAGLRMWQRPIKKKNIWLVFKQYQRMDQLHRNTSVMMFIIYATYLLTLLLLSSAKLEVLLRLLFVSYLSWKEEE